MLVITPRQARAIKYPAPKTDRKRATLRRAATQPLALLKEMSHGRRIQHRQEALQVELGLVREPTRHVTVALPLTLSGLLAAASGAGTAIALLMHHASLGAVIGASVGVATLVLFLGLCAFRPLATSALRRAQSQQQDRAEARYLAKHFAPAYF